jgi:DNA-binding transcriptional LysR family regulator
VEFDDLRAFVTVADTGSVSQAARELYITQSAVTRRLQRLETSLNTMLLDRRTRPVTLTAAGQVVLERCRRVLNEFREVRAAAANGHLLSGEIKIGVAHALTELTFTEPIGKLCRKIPQVALRLFTGWSRDLLERVRSGSLDAAVILLPEGERLPAEVVGNELGKERLVIVAPRRGSLSRARRIQDLSGANWILGPDGCAARALLRQTLLRSNINMVPAVETFNYELQFALVARKRGLTFVPERMLLRSRFRSRLRVLNVNGLHFPLTIWMIHGKACAGLDVVITELGMGLEERL